MFPAAAPKVSVGKQLVRHGPRKRKPAADPIRKKSATVLPE